MARVKHFTLDGEHPKRRFGRSGSRGQLLAGDDTRWCGTPKPCHCWRTKNMQYVRMLIEHCLSMPVKENCYRHTRYPEVGLKRANAMVQTPTSAQKG